MSTLVLPLNCDVALVNVPVPVNTVVSSAITVTPFLPKNDCTEDVNVRPRARIDAPFGNIAVVKALLVNALPEMLLTEDGIIIDVNELPQNAAS